MSKISALVHIIKITSVYNTILAFYTLLTSAECFRPSPYILTLLASLAESKSPAFKRILVGRLTKKKYLIDMPSHASMHREGVSLNFPKTSVRHLILWTLSVHSSSSPPPKPIVILLRALGLQVLLAPVRYPRAHSERRGTASTSRFRH